jgi:predicted Zn-dependent protease
MMLSKRFLILLLSGLVFLAGCTTAPMTGRRQIMLVSEQEENALGLKAFQEVLKKEKPSTDAKLNAMVSRIGSRISAVANKPDYNWEFKVIQDDKTANAFCLPGGKVAVYTGILQYTKTEAGLAFVIAHEVAHAIARHGGERMSQQLLVQLGQQGLNIAIADKSPVAVEAFNTGYGVASQVGVILPFSRHQETEADQIGMVLMAKAGYDPHAARRSLKKCWHAQKAIPPAFLSTHPADEQRIRKIREFMPQAMVYYRPR